MLLDISLFPNNIKNQSSNQAFNLTNNEAPKFEGPFSWTNSNVLSHMSTEVILPQNMTHKINIGISINELAHNDDVVDLREPDYERKGKGYEGKGKDKDMIADENVVPDLMFASSQCFSTPMLSAVTLFYDWFIWKGCSFNSQSNGKEQIVLDDQWVAV